MRLIDADAFKSYMRNALEETRNCYPDGGEWAETITDEFCKDIDEQLTIEEIIHCKDCKWKDGSECVRFAEIRTFPNDFCSRAERRTDE